ncbi:MAG TPA: shikimate kinase [Gemmatimonadales bacterium]|nr:shikimate kinase [Gemmatimonadales bacterium]
MSAPSRHCVLVGLPGSGKSTVGPLLAARLGLPFHDVDAILAGRAGKPVGRIFGEDGEARFRALERALVLELLEAPPAVLAPGGGWAAQPGALEEVRERALLIYLCVAPETAAARLETTGAAERPLLAGAAPLERLRNLLAAREGYYRRAHLTVAADGGDPDLVASRLARAARIAESQVAD